MPRQNINQTNFTSGEISPLVGGRLDTKIYANGLRTCKNFIVRPQGGVVYRSGTKLIAPAKLHDSTCRLFPFDFSDVQGYALIFGDGYIHLVKNGHKLLETTFAEIENFDFNNEGGLAEVDVDDVEDLPGWGPLDTYSSAADNGTSGLESFTGTIGGVSYTNKAQINFSVPHTLRSGVLAYFRSSATLPSINAAVYSVLRLDNNSVVLPTVTYAGATVSGDIAMWSAGVLPGDEIYITGIGAGEGGGDWTAMNGFSRVAAIQDSTHFSLANKAVSGGSGSFSAEKCHCIPIEITTSYTAEELSEITVTQSADVLYITHPDHPVRKLIRLDDDGDVNDWLLTDVSFTDGPYLPENDASPTVDETTPANGTRFPDVYLEVSDYTSTATVSIPAITITALASNGGNFEITSEGHGLIAGDKVIIAGVHATLNGNRSVLAVVNASKFTIAVAYAAGTLGTYQPAFKTGDDSKYFEFKDGENWRLAQLPSTMSDYDVTATVNIIENVLLYDNESFRIKNTPKKREDIPLVPVYNAAGRLTNYQQASSTDYHRTDAAAAGTGVITAQLSNAFSRGDIGKYIRYHAVGGTVHYWARINKVYTDGSKVDHDASLSASMASINGSGSFVITNEARTATIKSYRNNAAHTLFTTTSDVGRHIRLGFSNRWVWGKITAVGSTSSVSVSLYSPMPRDPHDASKLAGSSQGLTTSSSRAVGRTYQWRLGAWSITTGYPSVAAFHENRLWFGRTDTEPSTLWGSVTGDYENMSPTEPDGLVLADSAIRYPIASGRVNAIKWIESGTALVVGTNGGEWLAKSSSVNQEPLTQANVGLTQQSRNGSSRYALPVRVGSSILFVNRSEQKMMEVAYLFSEDSLKDKDVTVAAEHIIRNGGRIVEIAYQQNPNSIIWCLLSDGTLCALTHNNNQEILGWHRHEVGGDGFVESICCVPSEDGTNDVLHMVVKRTINGGTYRTIEYLTPDFHANGATARTGMVFLDCAHVISNFTGTTITGLSNLDGKTVTVVSDGTVVSTTSTVGTGANSGILSPALASAANEVVIGLPYTGTITSLPIEGGSQHGTSQGMKKRVAELKVRLFESFGFTSGTFLGAAPTTLVNVTDHDVTAKNETFTPLPFFSGTVAINPKMGNDLESVWTIQQTKPYPLTVLSVTSVPETSQ